MHRRLQPLAPEAATPVHPGRTLRTPGALCQLVEQQLHHQTQLVRRQQPQHAVRLPGGVYRQPQPLPPRKERHRSSAAAAAAAATAAAAAAAADAAAAAAAATAAAGGGGDDAEGAASLAAGVARAASASAVSAAAREAGAAEAGAATDGAEAGEGGEGGEGAVQLPPSPFFSEQLTSFEIWLRCSAVAGSREPPDQLPILLQARDPLASPCPPSSHSPPFL